MVTELCYVGAGIGNQPVTRVLTVLTLIQHGLGVQGPCFRNHQHEISFTAASAQPSTAQHQPSPAQRITAQLSELSLFLHGRSKGVQFPPPANRLTG